MNAIIINQAYWAFSAVFCCCMLATAVGDLLRVQALADDFRRLGYPDYRLTVLGVAKVLGVAALLCPGVPHLKEWAYAGFTFVLLGATISQIVSVPTLGPAIRVGSAGPLPARTPEASGGRVGSLRSAKAGRLLAHIMPALVCLFLLAGSYLSYRMRVSSV